MDSGRSDCTVSVTNISALALHSWRDFLGPSHMPGSNTHTHTHTETLIRTHTHTHTHTHMPYLNELLERNTATQCREEGAGDTCVNRWRVFSSSSHGLSPLMLSTRSRCPAQLGWVGLGTTHTHTHTHTQPHTH